MAFIVKVKCRDIIENRAVYNWRPLKDEKGNPIQIRRADVANALGKLCYGDGNYIVEEAHGKRPRIQAA